MDRPASPAPLTLTVIWDTGVCLITGQVGLARRFAFPKVISMKNIFNQYAWVLAIIVALLYCWYAVVEHEKEESWIATESPEPLRTTPEYYAQETLTMIAGKKYTFNGEMIDLTTPTLHFNDGTNTGFYEKSDDSWGIVVDGVEIIEVKHEENLR